MIIWIASYPKSGNTWVRAIISSLVYSKDGIFTLELLKKINQFPTKYWFKDLVNDFSNFSEIKKNWIIAQDKINLDNKVKFFKTHQGKYTVCDDNFTNKENTKAVIYIVRDPRNVVLSVSNFYNLSEDESVKFLTSPEVLGNKFDKKSGILTLLGTWGDHFKSWTLEKENLLLLKYEDLISNPYLQLQKIINFLKKYQDIQTNELKDQKILETTNFTILKKIEENQGFDENQKKFKDKKFFNLGANTNWQKMLKKESIKTIEEKFQKEMKELGYLKII